MPKSTLTENRYAVCIGINEYQPAAGLSSLRYAEGDAQAMDRLLGQLGFEAENRRLLLGEAATLDAVNKALSDIILDKAKKNDLVVFYFAGHSLPLTINEDEEENEAERRSEVFLTTYDFDREKIKQIPSFRRQHALGMERLRKDFFEGPGSRKRLFLFDSCYSGDFYGPRYRDEADPVQGYIKRMLESSSIGRVALSSCLPIQKAAEDPALGHGRFTYYLLEALSGRAVQALRHDGCLTVNSLFDYLAKQLPNDQRPVLSCQQQDTFELVCYSDRVESARHPMMEAEDVKHREREARLRALLADHSSFMHDRLSSFVGRAKELAEIRQCIAKKQQIGGYVTITGQAGQGKSSIIAKLVEEYGPENVAFHFIPFNPGPDHQVGLLRNLMARLILKYDLSDLYVASDSNAALRDYFPKVLGELAAKGGREVIFIDGLDQLEAEQSGERDLSFLPIDLPSGVVFVLGTRPNDILRPLELRKTHSEYQLPNLSRQDFDLILQRRQVRLDKAIAERFYQAMQENALYLDLVAKELAERGTTSPESIIKQIVDNPQNVFSLSMVRLKRPPTEWREVIKPVLGVMLVAREPLGVRHIRQILGVDDDRLREGIERLGGLIVRDWQQRYSLFHPKLYEYLRQDEDRPTKDYIFATDEEEGWHKRLAQWCEGSNIAIIWQDAKYDGIEQRHREYARQHYFTHLYDAREWTRLYGAHEWPELFKVLDTVQYGEAKIRNDLSTRSYAHDLDLGRKAASWEGWPLEEGIRLLPHLWQYTLLRCSLTSRADQYPLVAFRLLVLLKRKQEALGLAELLTRPTDKVRAFLQIAEQRREQPNQEREWLALLLRAREIARTIEDSRARDELLAELGTVLAQGQQWEQAQAVIGTIGDSYVRAAALGNLGTALAQVEQWEQAQALWREAQAIIGTIRDSLAHAKALGNLGTALAQGQQWEQAQVVIGMIEDSNRRAAALRDLGIALAQVQQWEQAQAVIGMIEDNSMQAEALRDLGTALAQAQQWEQAQAVIGTIKYSRGRAVALGNLGTALAQVERWEQAQAVWREVQAVISEIRDSVEQATALRDLGIALAQAQQWEQAQVVIGMIEDSNRRTAALRDLGTALAQAQQWEQAQAVIGMIEDNSMQAEALRDLGTALAQAQQWEQAQAVIGTRKDSRGRAAALRDLGIALAQGQQWEQAQAVWREAQAVIGTIRDSLAQAKALGKLGTTLAQMEQWEQAQAMWREAQAVIDMIEDGYLQAKALRYLGIALAQAQQWEQAQAIIGTIKHNSMQAEALENLGTALAQAQQWEQAQAVIGTIKYSSMQAKALGKLGIALAQGQQWEQAQAMWREAQAVIGTIRDSLAQAAALPTNCATRL